MKAKVRVSGTSVALLMGAILMGDANASWFGDPVVFQSVEISNDGRGAVKEVSVLYGGMQLAQGPARREYRAGNPVLNRYAQGFDSSIPTETRLHWVTEDDGQPHDVTIPTRSLVNDLHSFYGFRFWFSDGHIDVYLIEKIPNPGNYLNVKYTKVYSK